MLRVRGEGNGRCGAKAGYTKGFQSASLTSPRSGRAPHLTRTDAVISSLVDGVVLRKRAKSNRRVCQHPLLSVSPSQLSLDTYQHLFFPLQINPLPPNSPRPRRITQDEVPYILLLADLLIHRSGRADVSEHRLTEYVPLGGWSAEKREVLPFVEAAYRREVREGREAEPGVREKAGRVRRATYIVATLPVELGLKVTVGATEAVSRRSDRVPPYHPLLLLRKRTIDARILAGPHPTTSLPQLVRIADGHLEGTCRRSY